MARPIKNGVDYFPLDVDISENDKMAVIEAKHGIIGYGVIIKLFAKIYKNGYYYKWSEIEKILFADKVKVPLEEVEAIIKDSVKFNLFDEKMYEKYKILTSAGIQERYFSICSRRKKIEVKEEYLLVNIEDYNNNSQIKIVKRNSKSKQKTSSSELMSTITQVKEECCQHDVNNNTQSKVKESKVNKSILNICSPGGERAEVEKAKTDSFDVFWKAYPRKVGKANARKAWKKIKVTKELLEKILAALERAKKSEQWNKDNGQYIPHPTTWLNREGWEDEYQITMDTFEEKEDYYSGAEGFTTIQGQKI